MNIQSKTFYIELIGDKNYIINNDYILEFSSNLDSIKPIFNKEFNYSNIIESESSQKYYISKDNLEERKLYNFKIELDKTNNIIDFDAYKKDNLVSSNYIIKFYKKENYNSIDFIKNKDIVVERKSDTIEDYSRYNFAIKNKKKQNYNNDFNFKYLLSICYTKYVYETQILNSIAINNNCDNHTFTRSTEDPNKEFYFELDLENNEKYFVYLFMIVKDKNEGEKYFSTFKEFETKENNNNNNKKHILLIYIIFGILFIIAIFITTIIFIRYKKKNQNLREQIQSISFKKGINDTDKGSEKEIILI